MIAFIEGQVTEIRETSVVLRAGLLGIEVSAPGSTLGTLRRGESVSLHTHLVVKEDLLALYGFSSRDELALFRHVITVSGVGPRLGLALLTTLPVNIAARALLDGDAALLATTPGIGKRTAERLILELGGKLPEELAAGTAATGATPGDGAAVRDAVEALLALGFREGQVRSTVAGLQSAHPDEGAEGLIRLALARLR